MNSEAAMLVLQDRARALAERPADVTVDEVLDVVRLVRRQETLLIESAFVMAVFNLSRLSRLPRAAAPVAGVTAWRGDLLLLVDVTQPHNAAGARKVVVLGDGATLIGLLADEVPGIESVPLSQLHDLTRESDGISFVRALSDHPAALLDAQRLLQNFSGGTR